MNQFLWSEAVMLGLLVALIWSVFQRRRQRAWPLNSFLFNPGARFSDLTTAHVLCHRKQPYALTNGPVHVPYFPLVCYVLRALSGHGLVLLYRLTYAGLAFVFARLVGLPPFPAFVLLIAGYPILFCDDRGGLDHMVSLTAGIGVALLLNGYPVYGGLALALASAAKGYSLPFYLLWLLRGEHAALALSGCAMAGLYLLPGMAFEGGIRATARGHMANLRVFSRVGVMGEQGPAFCTAHYCCDWFNAIRLLQWWRMREFTAARWLRPYVVLSTVAAGALAYRAATADSIWVALLALGLIQLVWPHVANDYKLATLIPGIAYWLLAGAPNWVVFACLALLWAPKHYWFPAPKFTAASISCLVSPVILTVLVIVI